MRGQASAGYEHIGVHIGWERPGRQWVPPDTELTGMGEEQHDWQTGAAEEETRMARVTNPDCVALGCEWDWDTLGCGRCGGSHTFRICVRCLVAPDDELCPVTVADEDSGVAA